MGEIGSGPIMDRFRWARLYNARWICSLIRLETLCKNERDAIFSFVSSQEILVHMRNTSAPFAGIGRPANTTASIPAKGVKDFLNAPLGRTCLITAGSNARKTLKCRMLIVEANVSQMFHKCCCWGFMFMVMVICISCTERVRIFDLGERYWLNPNVGQENKMEFGKDAFYL